MVLPVGIVPAVNLVERRGWLEKIQKCLKVIKDNSAFAVQSLGVFTIAAIVTKIAAVEREEDVSRLGMADVALVTLVALESIAVALKKDLRRRILLDETLVYLGAAGIVGTLRFLRISTGGAAELIRTTTLMIGAGVTWSYAMAFNRGIVDAQVVMKARFRAKVEEKKRDSKFFQMILQKYLRIESSRIEDFQMLMPSAIVDFPRLVIEHLMNLSDEPAENTTPLFLHSDLGQIKQLYLELHRGTFSREKFSLMIDPQELPQKLQGFARRGREIANRISFANENTNWMTIMSNVANTIQFPDAQIT